MSAVDRRAVALGFLGAGAVFAVLLYLVDLSRVRRALLQADPPLLAVTLAVAVLWLVAWGLTLRFVLDAVGVEVPYLTAFFVYTAAVFANNVTPFGQAGGEPVTAYLISKISSVNYETGLVAIASVDVVNVIASVGLVLFAVGYYATSVAIGSGLKVALGSVVVLVAVIFGVFALIWRYRTTIVDRISGPLAGVIDRVDVGPLSRFGADEERVARRLRGFFADVEVVATDRTRLTAAFASSTAGWLLQAVALVAAFAAIGQTLPFVVAVFVIPLAYLAGMTPLPGGLGGIEAAFVALLVPTIGASAAVITAGVIVFRVAVYWMPIALGGLATTVFGTRLDL
ncbi:MAG: YbhN family protein [Halanaeroarchaeum sp.]